VLPVSTPYALKAADAETLGGFPASAFALAAPTNSNAAVYPGHLEVWRTRERSYTTCLAP
jgi:hypothetical protein